MSSIPSEALLASDYQRIGRQALDPALNAFLEGGAGEELTCRANRAALDALHVHNRILAPLADGHTRTRLFGQDQAHPILLAPLALQGLYHREGERASAQAAEATDTCLVLSTLSSIPMEEVAACGGPRWFQLYFQPRREDTLRLVRRAEAAGYQALMVTVDTPVIPMSPRAQRLGFQLPDHVRPVHLENCEPARARPIGAGESLIFQGLMADAPSWRDLDWLVTQTDLPVIIKGVSHPDDAAACLDHGAAGIAVSTHGGRSLDGLPGAVQLLPAIRDRLGPQATILFDSGIRSGRDAFIALAMGANAVMVGRLQAYALAAGGALGVGHMLKLLCEELELTMALAGCARLEDINPACLAHQVRGL